MLKMQAVGNTAFYSRNIEKKEVENYFRAIIFHSLFFGTSVDDPATAFEWN